jgi:hypothetical protein
MNVSIWKWPLLEIVYRQAPVLLGSKCPLPDLEQAGLDNPVVGHSTRRMATGDYLEQKSTKQPDFSQ